MMESRKLYNTKTLTVEDVINELDKAPDHLMFVKSTPENKYWLDLLASKIDCNEIIAIKHKPIQIVKVMYNQKEIATNERNYAVNIAFSIFTKNGYNKHHAKDPFKCKDFCNYYLRQDIPFMESDYIIVDAS